MYRYRESLLSRQLYDFNKNNIIKKDNPIVDSNKNKFESVYCGLWYIRKMFKKIVGSDVFDEEQLLSKEEMENDCSVLDVESIPRVAVYTCIVGGYDKLWEPLYKSEYCDFYAITDFAIDQESIWQRIDYRDYENSIERKDSVYINRWFKMHPHKIFFKYDYSIYIDGNVLIVADVIPLVLKMVKDNNWLGMHSHYARKYLKSEAEAIIKRKKNVDKVLLRKQINNYMKDGYNDDVRLLEATIIIRKHNDSKCIEVMEDWWEEFLRGVPRDQISLPYVLWKNGLSMDNITVLGKNEYLNPRFVINKHS